MYQQPGNASAPWDNGPKYQDCWSFQVHQVERNYALREFINDLSNEAYQLRNVWVCLKTRSGDVTGLKHHAVLKFDLRHPVGRVAGAEIEMVPILPAHSYPHNTQPGEFQLHLQNFQGPSPTAVNMQSFLIKNNFKNFGSQHAGRHGQHGVARDGPTLGEVVQFITEYNLHHFSMVKQQYHWIGSRDWM